ncbi:SBBP repeat-containing protein [Chryseobacterium gregarium]|uniref:SBBP repeat-containing protein n=1 Tax=Chryseobacterium gregarium TaxID=456299 RepID=UPI0003FFB62A|nr:SBBP repeat-containing protein [Chryseobacterium gregarium]
MKLKTLFFILLFSGLSAQFSFNYQRDWATYFGAVNSQITGIYEDNSSNIFVDAKTNSPNPVIGTPPVSYYNQFITAGSQSYAGSFLVPNNFSGKFTSTGNLISAGYTPYATPVSSAKFPYFRDQNGNMYEFQTNLITYPALSPGAWLANAPDSINMILTKYDVNNTMLWQTYLPGNNNVNNLEVDNNGNIYVAGTTKWQNLSDPGTFQPTFNMVYDAAGIILPNSYIVKLNPQGQKIWATYTPSILLVGMTAFEDKLYIIGNKDLEPTGADLSTSGTFQPAKAGQFITRLNANTGQRT